MMGRLMGLLLCAMAVQFGINALKQMGLPLTLSKLRYFCGVHKTGLILCLR